MKIFLLLLFTTTVVTAAPHASASNEVKLQRVILEEIIQSIRDVQDSLVAEVRLISVSNQSLNND